MDSDDCDNNSDIEIDDAKHAQLIENVLNINKATGHVKKPTRTEPSTKISEFNLVKSITGKKGSIYLDDLTKVLKKRSKHAIVTKKLQNTATKNKTLSKPLEKPQADRIKRSVAYEKARLQLDRWDAFVTSNRAASHLSFPLNYDTRMELKNCDMTNSWRLKSDLEKKLEEIEPKVEIYEQDTEKKFPLTMREILERRKETAKLRAHQSYKEAKARRQNKIKSKKYHRIQKRVKIKQKLKEFELLQKINPEEALKKLDEIEKVRAEERMSLRHKSTGKWARSKQIRAKYDKESRKALSEQLTVSKDLTQKVKTYSDSESEDDVQVTVKKLTTDDSNPWVNSNIEVNKEVGDFISNYRKFWSEKNEKPLDNDNPNVEVINVVKTDETPQVEQKQPKKIKNIKQIKKTLKIPKQKVENAISTEDWCVETLDDEDNINNMFDKLDNKIANKLQEKLNRLQKRRNQNNSQTKAKNKRKSNKKLLNVDSKKMIDLTMPVQTKKPIIDEELAELPHNSEQREDQNINSEVNALKTILENKVSKPTENIDPNKFIKPKSTVTLNTQLPDMFTTDENEEEIDQRGTIAEAFQDDDIVENFKKDKSEDIRKKIPKNIDLSLPGWGSWGGRGLNISKAKRRRFIIKFPKQMPRKDQNKGNLIINEDRNSKIKEHLVSELPFPFKTVKDYEASIRAPVGSTFVPESAFRRLIRPAVTTKMGAIIEPIKKDILLGKQKAN